MSAAKLSIGKRRQRQILKGDKFLRMHCKSGSKESLKTLPSMASDLIRFLGSASLLSATWCHPRRPSATVETENKFVLAHCKVNIVSIAFLLKCSWLSLSKLWPRQSFREVLLHFNTAQLRKEQSQYIWDFLEAILGATALLQQFSPKLWAQARTFTRWILNARAKNSVPRAWARSKLWKASASLFVDSYLAQRLNICPSWASDWWETEILLRDGKLEKLGLNFEISGSSQIRIKIWTRSTFSKRERLSVSVGDAC